MLDTDICSFIIKRANEKLLKRLRRTPVEDVCISVITKAELLYGVDISPRPKTDEAAVAAFLTHIAVLDFPDEATPHYAAIRGYLKLKGTMIGANDLLIAAHARAVSLTLVTNNTGEFGRVPQLKLENWAA
ncbi:MAG TPA: PIN domain-containing protein [Rhizomicrobium sp.]|jgi:tRNA(fMet)-specific endonuclease VapC|nr:PIN domain-containing protein [Rhizomicrobium sp.]